MQEIVHPKGKVYYTMGEVAEMFDVKPSLLRYWEQEFDLLKPHRNKKGNRLYTPQDVDNIKIIYHLLKERGMKIETARKFIREKPTGAGRDTEIMERLMSVRSLLVEIRDSLSIGGEFVEDDPAEVVAHEEITTRVEIAAGKPAVPEQNKFSPAAAGEEFVSDKSAPEESFEYDDQLPPFEEQPLFELVPPREFGSVDEAMDAFIAKHYDAQADENKPEADPFAPFTEEGKNGDISAKPEEDAGRRPVIIEQTLF